MIMKNKRGDISITLLVFMVVVLTGSVLFSFIRSSGKITGNIADSRFLEGAYFGEEGARSFMKAASEDALIKSYYEVANEKGDDLFKNFDEIAVDNLIKEKFNAKFAEEIKKYGAGEKVMQDLLAEVEKGNFVSSFDGDGMSIEIKDFAISAGVVGQNKETKIGVIYRPKMIVNVSLEELGLYGFWKINNAIEKCKSAKSDSEISNCFSSELSTRFLVDYNKKVLGLESRRVFLIGNELRSIKISARL